MEQQNKVSSRWSPWNRKSPPLKPKFKTASKQRVIQCKKSDKLKLQPSNSFDPIRWKTSSTYALDRIRWHFHIVNWLQQMKPSFVFTLSITCGHHLVPHQCEPLTEGVPWPATHMQASETPLFTGFPKRSRAGHSSVTPTHHPLLYLFSTVWPKILTSEAPPPSRAYIISNTGDR